MRPISFALAALALACASAPAEIPAESEALLFKLEVYEEDLARKAAERRRAGRESLATDLREELEAAQQAAELDRAIALRTVVAALGKDEPLPVVAKTGNLPAGVMAKLLEQHREEAKIDSALARAVREKTLQVVKVLDQHVVDATKAGELDAAAALRKRVDAIRPAELPARPPGGLVQAGDPPGGVPPLDTRLVKGLAAFEFEKLEKQKDDNTRGVHFGEFGKAVTKRDVSKCVHKWRWDSSRNAVAIGYLKIEEAGEYSFSTYNWWDRNALYVLNLDKPLCYYRDHGAKHKIELPVGYVPIIAVGYPEAKGDFGYAGWKPPGAEKHEAIPDRVLFHSRAAADELVRRIEAGTAP